MSNPPSWLMWIVVIIVTIYVLDIILKVILYTIAGYMTVRLNKKNSSE